MPKIRTGTRTTASNGKSRKTTPETCEDWIEVAADLEESGDRWVQQPDKAHRFYLQAAEAYETAVKRDATNVDAAYNAARLPLVMAQNCALLAVEQIRLLELAAIAHEQLISRFADHVDAKFNLATVLLLWVELVTTHEVLTGKRDDAAVEQHLLHAMQLLEACRMVQSAQLAMLTEEQDVDDSVDAGKEDVTASELQQAIDISYITHDILLDTLIALLDGYGNMLSANISSEHLRSTRSHILSVVVPQIEGLLPQCASGQNAVDRYAEIQRSIQLAELAHANEQGSLPLSDWKQALEQLIASRPTTLEAACSFSDACIELAKAMHAQATDEAALQEVWKVYTAGAAAQLSAAVQHATNLQIRRPDIWVARADVELLRSNLGSKTSIKNLQVLRTNAKIYYKRARAECLPKHIRINHEAALKLAVLTAELEEGSRPAMPENLTKDEAKQIISDARADGLFPGSWKLLS